MAVVLPVHGHINFGGCSENGYENQCQNEEEQTGEAINENDESNLFLYNEFQNEIPGNGSLPCHPPPLEKADYVTNEESDLSMDVDDEDSNRDEASCDDVDKKPNSAETLNSCGQNDSSMVDPTSGTDSNPNDSNEEEDALLAGDNYWLMDSKIENELAETPDDNKDESDSGVENLALLSSLMEVDSVNATADVWGHGAESNESGAFNAPSLNNEDERNDPKEDKMEVEADEIPTVEDLSSAVTEIEAPKDLLYGGLDNLGNTCYMASAIQLLCGLDSFPTELKNKVPPENNVVEDATSGDSKPELLRDALLNVMHRLKNGETVRPDELKRCIDSRTSLFLGYHQQDSHEFLTTLLDIIDEDYKKKSKPEESTSTEAQENDEKEQNNNSRDNDRNDDEKSVNERLELSKKSYQMLDTAQTDEETNGDEGDDAGNMLGTDRKSLESAVKRQKIVEDETSSLLGNESTSKDAMDSGNTSTDTDPVKRSKSFSQFHFRDIESLLHDEHVSPTTENVAAITGESSSSLQEKNPAKQDGPKCKLAGGRMNTVGVELTRFVEGGDVDEVVRPTGASLDKATPQQQIMEGGQHDEEEERDGDDETSLSPVSSNFTTKVRVCLTCESCKFRRSHIETYLHISLDIATASSDDDDDDDAIGNLGVPSGSSIEDGLRRFFAPEKRDIKCEKCFHTSALQTSEITQLPRNLLFHLKRFIVDVSPDYSSIFYRKDQSPVVFEERMELDDDDDDDDDDDHRADDGSDSDPLRRGGVRQNGEEGGFRDFLAVDCSRPEGAAYEIRSVVNHIGSSASCGHYTADAYRRKQTATDPADRATEGVAAVRDVDDDVRDEEPDREWMRFNDSYVSKITSKEAVEDASQTAYMIMYELVQ